MVKGLRSSGLQCMGIKLHCRDNLYFHKQTSGSSQLAVFPAKSTDVLLYQNLLVPLFQNTWSNTQNTWHEYHIESGNGIVSTAFNLQIMLNSLPLPQFK